MNTFVAISETKFQLARARRQLAEGAYGDKRKDLERTIAMLTERLLAMGVRP